MNLQQIAQELHEFSRPGLPAIAAIEVTHNQFIIAHDATGAPIHRGVFDDPYPASKGAIALSYYYGFDDFACHFFGLYEVGEPWQAAYKHLMDGVVIDDLFYDESPWMLEMIDEDRFKELLSRSDDWVQVRSGLVVAN